MKIEEVIELIKAEPEFPGDMPDEMFALMCKDKDAATEAMRIAVRLTKEGVIKRLREASHE